MSAAQVGCATATLVHSCTTCKLCWGMLGHVQLCRQHCRLLCLLCTDLTRQPVQLLLAGLQAGKTFTEDLLGDEFGDMREAVGNDEDDNQAANRQQQGTGQSSKQQKTAGAGAGQTARQQQQQQARQDTLTRKADSGQSVVTFNAYDRAVLAQLPEFVQQQVPFITTAKGAVDGQLLQLITQLVTSGVSFSNITDRLRELAHTQHYLRELVYYSVAKEAHAAAVAARGM